MSGFRGKIKRFNKLLVTALFVFAVVAPGIYSPQQASADSIVFKGAASANTGTGSSSTLVINKPSGVNENDVMIAVIGSISADPDVTPPAGWTSALVTTTGAVTFQSFWKRAGASEGSNYSFAIDISGRIAGGISAYRGAASSGSPIDALSSSPDNNGVGTSPIPHSVTPTTNNAKIIGIYGMIDLSPRTFTPPNTTGISERVDTASNNGSTDDMSVAITDYHQTSVATFTPAAATTSGSGTWAAQQIALKPNGIANMMLFWEGAGSAPNGWSYVTEAEGRFLRGGTPGEYGALGGQNSHTHSMDTPTLGGPNIQLADLGGGTGMSAAGHTHGMPTTTSATATDGNIPAFRSLRLIRYDSGIPNTIPAGGIAIFDNSPGIPATGWTRLATQDNQVVKIDSSIVSGGSDTHSHSISWNGGLTAAAGQTNRFCFFFGCETSASTTHTHSMPGSSTSNTATQIPPYIQSLLAKAESDTPVLSIGLTAMFDGAPGGGWVVRSESGGPYYRKFIRPASVYSEAGGGAAGHTPTGGAVTSGGASGNGSTAGGGTGVADQGHTHVVTPVFTPYTSDPLFTGNVDYFLPPYYNIVVAEKVNFIFNHYAWYDDNNALAVTSPYSSLNIGADNHINPLPVGNEPPDLNKELRLRIQILVNNSDLAANEMEFRLQFKADTSTALTTTTCTDGTWTDVGNNGDSTIWKYAASGPANGAQLTGSSVFSPASTSLHRYVKATGAGNNISAVTAGQTMEWDYHIMNNGADPATQYRFRLVEDSGILLSQYGYGSPTVTPVCPTLTTRQETANQLRHGNFFDSTGREQGFSWVD